MESLAACAPSQLGDRPICDPIPDKVAVARVSMAVEPPSSLGLNRPFTSSACLNLPPQFDVRVLPHPEWLLELQNFRTPEHLLSA